MKDTLTKLRALISMKSCLIEALRADLAAAAAKIDVLTDANQALCKQNSWLIQRQQQLFSSLDTIKEEQRVLLRDNQELVKQMEEWWAQQDDDKDWIDVQVNLDREKDHA